jgi:OPA family glycerol-3-phosphate transporter-like MFS transporter
VCTFVFGFVKEIYLSLTAMIVLQTLNGWFNGMGWAPCGKTMVHWFSTKERGTCGLDLERAHNVGGASWRRSRCWACCCFTTGARSFTSTRWFPRRALLIAWLLIRDTPQSCGLPPIEEYKNDYPPNYSAEHERTFTFRRSFSARLQQQAPVGHRHANAFVYFVRYGVVDWIPTYLQTAKGFSFQQSSTAWACFRVVGGAGHDFVRLDVGQGLQIRRAPGDDPLHGPDAARPRRVRPEPQWPAVDRHRRAHRHRLLHLRADHAHRPASARHGAEKGRGHRRGLHRLLWLCLWLAIAGTGVGWIADHWGWGGVIGTMIVCCVLTMVFSAMTLGTRRSGRTDSSISP